MTYRRSLVPQSRVDRRCTMRVVFVLFIASTGIANARFHCCFSALELIAADLFTYLYIDKITTELAHRRPNC